MGTAPGLAARLDRALARSERAFVGGVIAFTSLLLFVNVLLRYVFHAPISWAEELTLYLMAWMVFVGGSVAVRTRGHMAIDLLPLVLSPANRRRLAIFVAALSIAFFAAFLWFSAQHVLRVRSAGQTTPIMGAPMWLAYLAMPAGSLLMALRTAQLLATILRRKSAATEATMDLQD